MQEQAPHGRNEVPRKLKDYGLLCKLIIVVMGAVSLVLTLFSWGNTSPWVICGNIELAANTVISLTVLFFFRPKRLADVTSYKADYYIPLTMWTVVYDSGENEQKVSLQKPAPTFLQRNPEAVVWYDTIPAFVTLCSLLMITGAGMLIVAGALNHVAL